jgi:hypothetical protein
MICMFKLHVHVYTKYIFRELFLSETISYILKIVNDFAACIKLFRIK